jgi:hypothetical protein
MRRLSLFLVILAVVLSPGCDGPKPVLPPPPPHGGTAFPLPQRNGFVEVLRQEAPDQPGQTRLVVYFLDSACKPLPSAPSDATFQPRGVRSSRVMLTSMKESDPQKAGGLVSPPLSACLFARVP